MTDIRNTITLKDAERLTGPRAFNLMIKPVGSACNLKCRYCYYLEKAELYGGKEPKMSLELLEKCIREYAEAVDVPELTFNWHGGEPLLMGIDFYRKALEYERKYAQGRKIFNTIQTNGTMIDASWAGFLADNGFLIGISIDGPPEIHDRYRQDRGGAPTFDKVMRGIGLLHRYGAEYNTMTTVNKCSEGKGAEVYRFLKSLGTRYMQFLPVHDEILHKGRTVTAPWSVSPLGYGKFMTDIFDIWIREDVGRFFVNLFDATLAGWCGVRPGTCVYDETCGTNCVVEHNGDVYPCDHFVDDGYLAGNIGKESLAEIMGTPEIIRFGTDKRNTLPPVCLKCRWKSVCNGECPQHRHTSGTEKGVNGLCEGLQHFYRHVSKDMDIMKELLSEHRPPALVSVIRQNGKV